MDTTTLFWAIQSELLLSPHPWYVLVIMSQNRGSTEHWLRFLLKYVYIPCVEGLQNDNDNDTLFLIIMVSRKETQDRKGNRKKTRRGFVAHWMLGEVTWFWEAESQYTALQSMAKKGAANKKLKLHCFGYFWHQLGSLWIYKHIYIYIYQVVWICLILTREPLPRPLPISLGCWYQKMLHTPNTFGRCGFRFFDETDPPNLIWKWSYFPKCKATENPQRITIRVELNI